MYIRVTFHKHLFQNSCIIFSQFHSRENSILMADLILDVDTDIDSLTKCGHDVCKYCMLSKKKGGPPVPSINHKSSQVDSALSHP
ncbi:hypothetical protein OUZ56_008619 [Daphnia magna]|uniref:Zinc finger C3HC4 RING-type domain-containing protein n=1 Tax=Daphnia magna TaxID=35525 RepID=A0ABR0ADJ4_9CRUS|nr:hypothetical protein OUZ56_008619 [Daphnia magna]